MPRSEAQLRDWLRLLSVADWPHDNLVATCAEHLFFRWDQDGGCSLSPAGHARLANLAARGVKTAQQSKSHREQALAAYGDKCEECSSTDNLQICRLPDTELLLHPGGGKISGKDKYRRLVSLGFPAGWVVRCPEHPVR